jgi:predicted nucleic acid-binding protein
MRVVLDANVYLSGIPRLRDQDSPPRRLLGAWMSGAYDLLISDHIIDEVVRNLENPYFASILKGTDASLIFQEIRFQAEMIDLSPHSLLPREASHSEDNYVLATALEGGTPTIW